MLRFMIGLIEHTAKVAPAIVHVSAGFTIVFYGITAVLIGRLNRRQKLDPTWYNDVKEEESENVRTLKVA